MVSPAAADDIKHSATTNLATILTSAGMFLFMTTVTLPSLRARHERQHHDGQCDGACKPALLMSDDEQAVDEDAHDDRW